MKKLQIEKIIEPAGKFAFNLQELWTYRELFYFFTWRDIKVKYKQTVLGIVWVILQPLLTVLVFSLFFGRALNVPSSGLPYPVFVFSGLLLWFFFSSSVSNAGNSMVSNAHIIKKIYFPRLVIPSSALLVSSLDFLITFFVFIGFVIYYQVSIDFVNCLIFWPISIILMFGSTLGISCWLAALNVKYRDFRYIIPFVLQLLLFVSPVIYPGSIIKSQIINIVLAMNPMYGVINIFRIPLVEHNGNLELILISVASAILFFLVGLYYFRKTEAFFADIA